MPIISIFVTYISFNGHFARFVALCLAFCHFSRVIAKINTKTMRKCLLFVIFFDIITVGRGEMSERSNVLAWKAGRP